MTMCFQCSGSGHVRCPSPHCRGGWVTKAGGPSGGIEPCDMCFGSAKIRCAPCGGTGRIDQAGPGSDPPGKMQSPKNLVVVLVALLLIFVVFPGILGLVILLKLAPLACLLTQTCQ